MKTWMIRIAAALPGFLLLVNAVGLAVAPEGVVTSLGMTYLDGLGRSSQVGDTGAFFACGGLFIVFGAFRARPQWIMAGAFLFFAADSAISWPNFHLSRWARRPGNGKK